jgi:hypothetical protein
MLSFKIYKKKRNLYQVVISMLYHIRQHNKQKPHENKLRIGKKRSEKLMGRKMKQKMYLKTMGKLLSHSFRAINN